MKTVVSLIIVISAIWSHAQTNSLLFQWHGQTMGVGFEPTNLTDSVEHAIRDDIAYSLSLIPSTNVTFATLSPSSSGYGKYAGFITISHLTPINYCDGILCYYKNIGENVVFQLSQSVCSKYMAAIALTNQYASTINSFSNFYYHVQTGFNVTNMTLEEKKSYYWGAFVNEFEQEEGANFEQVLTATLSSRPATLPPWTFPPMPSILSFSLWEADATDTLPTPVLLCQVRRWDPVNKSTKWSFVYAGEKWRYCLKEF